MSTVVTSQSWFSRLAGAVTGMLVGLLLFVAGFPLLFWNEGRAVHRARDLEEGAANAQVLDAQQTNPDQQGKLVFVSDRATSDETLSDSIFAISAERALRFSREVEMYQWKESKTTKTQKKLGGGEETVTTYTYNRVWDDDLIKSNTFHDRTLHQNPDHLPYGDFSATAKTIHLGQYTIPDALKKSLTNFEPLAITAEQFETIRSKHATPLLLGDDYLYQGADLSSPAIGDVRIRFRKVPESDCALVGVLKEGSFAPYQTHGGRELFELRTGAHTKDAFFQQLVAENTMLTWILRGAGFAMMFFGLLFLSRPITVFADIVPFVGNLVGFGIAAFAFFVALAFSLFTIALGWIAYRPILGACLMLAAFAAIYLLRRLSLSRKSGNEFATAT